MAPGDQWLSSVWPRVRVHLPAAPARVIDVGCGRAGGFVPFLLADGYDALGVDPNAPAGASYRQAAFEDVELDGEVDAVIASTSLHHVADPPRTVDRLRDVLAPGGRAVVIEWAWEEFDEQVAEWCFSRLRPREEPGWAQRRHDEWRASGQKWPDYFRGWAEGHGLHRSDLLLRLLDESFERRHLARGPYLFADLDGTSEADEQAAIDAGELRPLRIDYVGIRA